MEFRMNKTLMFLGLATMICATPALAATSKTATPVVAKHTQEMCLAHGKKAPCIKHVSHLKHKAGKVQVATKKK
jgi:pyrimidine deaminase RibD-like protein